MSGRRDSSAEVEPDAKRSLSWLAGELRARDEAARDEAFRAKYHYLCEVAASFSTALADVLTSLEAEGALSADEVARMQVLAAEEDDKHEDDGEGAARLQALFVPGGPGPVPQPYEEIWSDGSADEYDLGEDLVPAHIRQQVALRHTDRAGLCRA